MTMGQSPHHVRLSKGLRLAYSILFLVAFYYLSYRYPLQIGDENTSPTYSPTPILFQIIKYLVLALVIFIILNVQQISFRSSHILISLIAVFSLFSIIICFIFAPFEFGATTRFFEIGFTMVFALLVASTKNVYAINFKFIQYLSVFYWINIISYLVQLGLFYSIGRLPALGYEGGNVRFGGIWDDPNSSFVPFILYTTYRLFGNAKPKENYVLIGLSILALLLGQSITAIFATIMTIGIMYFWFWKGAPTRTKLLNGAILTVGLSVFGALILSLTAVLPIVDTDSIAKSIKSFIEIKESSAATRSNTYSILFDAKFTTYLGLNPALDGGENSYINILVNFGAILMLVFVAVQILTIRALYFWTKYPIDRQDYATAMAFSAFYIWYVFSMLNLPMAEVFPDNLFAAIVAGSAIAATTGSTRVRLAHHAAATRRPAIRSVTSVGTAR